jgi:hypothetical protein
VVPLHPKQLEINLGNTYKFSSYLTENILLLHYKVHTMLCTELIIVYGIIIITGETAIFKS